MTGALALQWAAWIGLGFMLIGLLLTVYRLLRGPTLPDRVLALDLANTLGLGVVALVAILTGFHLYVDIAIALGLVGFLSTVALARYVERRGKGKGGEP